MRTLQTIECQKVSGGELGEAIVAAGALTCFVAFLGTLYGGPTYPVVAYEPYYQVFEVSYPVYDEYGYYLGDNLYYSYGDPVYQPVVYYV